ncbi:MAG: STAS/SEC14 domain-containing protein [Chitinophagaceae bacterium]|nr:STAS/SEC14 domain-containing protein [Chitinophagaceae bacterium]
MITPIPNIPGNMVGFIATDEVSKEDFEKVVMPAVDRIVEKTGELNYLLVIDTSLKNFTAGAWWQDALLGIKKIMKWRRAAIVSDSSGIITFTNFFNVVVPGEFKGFKPEALDQAIQWVSAE